MAIYIPEPEIVSQSMLVAQKAQQALKNIEAWPHWNLVQQVAQREYNLTTNEISVLLPEYQRFLALIAARPAGGIGMYSSEVDKLWHSHLLLTREYRLFCQEIYGRFIDHKPNLSLTSAAQQPKAQCTAPPTPPACIPDTDPVPCDYDDDPRDAVQSHMTHTHIKEECAPEPEPEPRCIPYTPTSSKCVASNYGRSHTLHDFVLLYVAAFGHNPPAVWNVRTADGVTA